MDMGGRRALTIDSLHKQYGPVVQIGPAEVSFNTIDAVDTIYGQQSEFVKSSWYDRMTRDGVFKIRNIAAHRFRRKQLGRAFSPASVSELGPSTANLVRKFVGVIEDRRHKGALEMRHWFRMLSFDLSGAAFVGAPFGGLDSETSPQFVSDMENAFLMWDLEGRFPILMWLFKQLPVRSWRHFLNGTNRIYQYTIDAFQDYVDLHGRTSNRKDMLAKLIQKPVNGVQGMTDYEIACEMSNLTFAATDTTALVLTFLFWELALHPEIQSQLRTELKKVEASTETDILLHRSLASLPLLNAVIQEAMRKHTPIPMGLLRQVPPGGRTMEGFFIPEEVRKHVTILYRC
jgi:cytochrome P450